MNWEDCQPPVLYNCHDIPSDVAGRSASDCLVLPLPGGSLSDALVLACPVGSSDDLAALFVARLPSAELVNKDHVTT